MKHLVFIFGYVVDDRVAVDAVVVGPLLKWLAWQAISDGFPTAFLAEGEEFPHIRFLGDVLSKLVDFVFVLSRSHLVGAEMIGDRR